MPVVTRPLHPLIATRSRVPRIDSRRLPTLAWSSGMGRTAKAGATSGAARSLAREAPPAEELPAPRPLLKWVGGKTQLLEQMQPLLPKTFQRYFEPFVGGAALFFDLRTRRRDMPAFLSDVNAELVNCYVAVRDEVEAVIRALALPSLRERLLLRGPRAEPGGPLAARARGAHDLPQQDGLQRALSRQSLRPVQRPVRAVHEAAASATSTTSTRARARFATSRSSTATSPAF